MNTQTNKCKYYENLFLNNWKKICQYDETIIQLSNRYKINKYILKSVVVIEQLNRGSLLISCVEKLIKKFFRKFVMSKNFSIGICQIKPNTALKVGLKIKDKNKLIQMLMLPKLNIHVCAKILAAVKNESIQNQILFYTTGTKELLYFFCPEVILYYHLCSISTKNKNFDF